MNEIKADQANSSGDLGTVGTFSRGISPSQYSSLALAMKNGPGSEPSVADEESVRLTIANLLKAGDIAGAVAIARAALAARAIPNPDSDKASDTSVMDQLPRDTKGGIPGVTGTVPGLAQGGLGPAGDQAKDEAIRGQENQLTDAEVLSQFNPMTPGKGSFSKHVVQPAGNPGLKYTNDDNRSKLAPDDVRDEPDPVEKWPGVKETPNVFKGYTSSIRPPYNLENVFSYWLLDLSYTDEARDKAAAKGQAMPGGSFPIRSKAELLKAKKAFGRAKNKSAARAHINKRAKQLGEPPLGGEEEKMAAEFNPVLYLSADTGMPQILAEGDEASGKPMKVRVPFYISNSLVKLPDFDKRVYFDGKLLPGIVAEAKEQLKAGKQPITVYARHKHATSADRLPIGSVTDVESEGRTGYATLEIEPTADGKDVQVLLRGQKLNAVSLRSKRFEMSDRKVNGESAYAPTKLVLDGIDFAPDAPAMETFGVEVLAAEAVVTDDRPTSKLSKYQRRVNVSEQKVDIDALRAESPEVIDAIEAPLKKQIYQLTAERDAFKEAAWQREKAEYIKTFAAKFTSDPAAAEKIMAEATKEAKSLIEVEAASARLLMEVVELVKAEVPGETTAEKLKKLLPGVQAGGNSKTVVAEKQPESKEDKAMVAEDVLNSMDIVAAW